MGTSPLRNQWGNILAWEYIARFDAEITQRKKNWLGSLIRNHGDDTTWSNDYNALMTIGNGAGSFSENVGWTSNQWKIEYTRGMGIEVVLGHQALPWSIDYDSSDNGVTLNAGNKNGSGEELLFCENNCS